jgi:hypothetical protein
VRSRFPNALDVRIDNPELPQPISREERRLTGRSPRALFDAFLAEGGIDDLRLGALFDELNDQITGGRP